jgi:hypothetical protein
LATAVPEDDILFHGLKVIKAISTMNQSFVVMEGLVLIRLCCDSFLRRIVRFESSHWSF